MTGCFEFSIYLRACSKSPLRYGETARYTSKSRRRKRDRVARVYIGLASCLHISRQGWREMILVYLNLLFCHDRSDYNGLNKRLYIPLSCSNFKLVRHYIRAPIPVDSHRGTFPRRHAKSIEALKKTINALPSFLAQTL